MKYKLWPKIKIYPHNRFIEVHIFAIFQAY
jgi:hypothetical protein